MSEAVAMIVEAPESTTKCSEPKEFRNIPKTGDDFENESPNFKDEIGNRVSTDSRIIEPEVEKNFSNDLSNLNDKGIDSNRAENRDDNDETFDAPTNKVKKKYQSFLHSDSEEDENPISETAKNYESDKESNDLSALTSKSLNKESNSSATTKKSRPLSDSDSDEDATIVEKIGDKERTNEDSSIEKTASITSKSRFRTLIDSESEEERDATKIEKKSNTKLNTIVDSESEYEKDSDSSHPAEGIGKSASARKKNVKAKKIKEKSKISALVDTDSEDDAEKRRIESFGEENENGGFSKKSEIKEKKRSISARAAKDEAMRQIHSETQRLIRSSAISLPYHRPKQRTLQDFLNRKKFIPALPEGLTTAAKVKMSTEIVGKVLEEKEKEAELFYKSSDSEDEKDVSTPMISSPADDSSRVDKISIEETQKISKNDLQNAHNKKGIIKQAGVDIGVPRKLFIDQPSDHCEKSNSIENEASAKDDDDVDKGDATAEPRRRSKETKPGMRDGSAPRKLFSGDYDEVSDSRREESGAAVVSNDSEISLSKKNTESDAENIDEGVHSLSKSDQVSSASECDADDLTLKLADSEFPQAVNCRDLDGLNSQKSASDGVSEISETPIISNKEYAKLNEREKSSRRETSENLPFGHVYGLPPPDIDEAPVVVGKTSETRKTLLKNVSSVGPKLRGSPGTMIDLTDDSRSNKDGVKSLVDRFMRHSATNKPSTGSLPVTVLHAEQTAEGVRLIEETIPYKLPTKNDAFTEKELQKPGAKYKRLRMDLIETMTKKRDEEWRLKEQREKDESEVEDDEEIEEIEEKSDKPDYSTESEPEVDDLPREKRRKTKPREFADEEAEVSGEEDEDDVEDDDDDDISLRVDNEDDTNEDPSGNEDSGKTMISRPGRILQAFEEDSNSQPEQSSDSGIENRGKELQRTRTDVDIFDNEEKENWSSDNEAEFPPSQFLHRDQVDARSQLCKTPLTAINALRFVSPITQLTALNSGQDSPRDSPSLNDDVSLASRRASESFADKTPNGLGESPIASVAEKRSSFQKKLFQDPAGTVNDEELLGLCSGKFTGLENDERSINGREITETQLLDLCSGSFPSQNVDDRRDKGDDDCSRHVRANSNVFCPSDDEESPSKETRKKPGNSSFLEVVSSSDDDDSDAATGTWRGEKSRKRRKIQRLELSDEEEDEEETLDEAEVDEERCVDYDSDENEIVVVPRKDLKKVAEKFLEAEAELSESEWGSEDEDEKDLDRLEFEEADEEDIDDERMRDQLGKMHVRRVQDDDQREVRMLQELLFEDGDLHTDGGGRERKFKWKNIDRLDNDEDAGARKNDVDDSGDPQDDENDLEWRIERIEREKFIEDKLKLSTGELTEELADDSQVFKLGIKALKRSKSGQNSQKEPEGAIVKPIASRTVLDLVDNQSLAQNTRILHKAVTRGSFLARGDECLARLAVHIKETSETTSLTRKNPKNFVFTHISPMVETSGNQKDDAPIDDSSESSKGKKRKSTTSVTPRTTKKSKVEHDRKPGKTLF